MQSNQHSNILDFLVQFLNEEKGDWTYDRLGENNTIITMGMQGHKVDFQVVIDVKENEKVILVYSIFSIYATEDKKLIVSELVNRLNYGLVLGNFEFDFTNGEIRFKNSCECKGIELSYEFLDNLMMSCIVTLDRASKCLVDVLVNGANPEQAYKVFRAENE